MIEFQGVSKDVARELCEGNMWNVLPKAKHVTEIRHRGSPGLIQDLDAAKLGRLCLDLGAGRSVGSSEIDHSVGIELLKSLNDRVAKDEVWLRVHHSSQALSQNNIANAVSSLSVADIKEPLAPQSKIAKVLTG